MTYRPHPSKLAKAKRYNSKNFGWLWNYYHLPSPLNKLNVNMDCFAYTVMMDQYHWGWSDKDVDGCLGPNTLAEYRKRYDLPDSDLPGQTLKRLVRVPAEPWEDRGYDYFSLREDVAEAYMAARLEVMGKGGIITSSGSMRSLSASVGSNRSKTSCHYAGIAFDLYKYSGMIDPHTDPFVVCQAPHTDKWVVYSRAAGGDEMDLTAWTKDAETVKTQGRFINFTDIMRQHGFEGISARSSYFSGNNFGGAEWWHFQPRKMTSPGVFGLITGYNTFGDTLREIYPLHKLTDTEPWKYRDRVWGDDWN